MWLTLLLYNFIYQNIGDVGNLEPILSFFFEAPHLQNWTILDLKLCKRGWQLSFVATDPSLEQSFNTSFQRDEFCKRGGCEKAPTLMEASSYSGILKSQGI